MELRLTVVNVVLISGQVKLVRVAGKEGEQVYIQIGDDEMEMLTQQQAEQVRETVILMLKHHLSVTHPGFLADF